MPGVGLFLLCRLLVGATSGSGRGHGGVACVVRGRLSVRVSWFWFCSRKSGILHSSISFVISPESRPFHVMSLANDVNDTVEDSGPIEILSRRQQSFNRNHCREDLRRRALLRRQRGDAEGHQASKTLGKRRQAAACKLQYLKLAGNSLRLLPRAFYASGHSPNPPCSLGTARGWRPPRQQLRFDDRRHWSILTEANVHR